MDKNAIKKYAVWARRELISRVSQRAALYEITDKGFGDASIDSVLGRVMSAEEKRQRQALIAQIREKGYEQVMEEIAYTWFNRFIALRFMEVNGYLPSRVRVFTDDENNFKPQILAEAINMELDGLDMEKVYALKNANDDDALFKYMIIVQCNALSSILPGMFQHISDYTELLFPDNLLREGSVIEQMVSMIPAEDWTDQIQIIGWLYQYYNTEPKDKVFADLKKNIKISKENIPAATQLFTPDWIVRYMVENSLGRLWLEGHPNDELKATWKYFLDEADQEPDVQAQLAEIRKEYASLKPEDILAIDPCQGSGHILAYMFDVLVQIYESYGYSAREAASSIVEHNIWGLDIDDRAAQLAYFSVMMKARQYDRRFFNRSVQPHVYAIKESNGVDQHLIDYFVAGRDNLKKPIKSLMDCLYNAKEYGSIIDLHDIDFEALDNRTIEIESDSEPSLYSLGSVESLRPLIQVGKAMAQKYHVVITNPPYMGASGMGAKLSSFVKKYYPNTKSDMSTVCMERALNMSNSHGYIAMINIPVWMFLSSYVELRESILKNNTYICMVHPGRGIFGSDFGTTAFVLAKKHIPDYIARYQRLFDRQGDVETVEVREQAFLAQKGAHTAKQERFALIPESPVAYWVSDAFLKPYFEHKPLLGDVAAPCAGLATGNNDLFQRIWTEVEFERIGFGIEDVSETKTLSYRWYPCNSGGEFRKWYPADFIVVDWESDGRRIKTYKNAAGKLAARPQNTQWYFKEGFTWNKLSASKFAVRYKRSGFVFDDTSRSAFPHEKENLFYYIGLLCSNTTFAYLQALDPTMSFTNGDLKRIPMLFDEQNREAVEALVKRNIELSKNDWDSFELSWDFIAHPIVTKAKELQSCASTVSMETMYNAISNDRQARFNELKRNEEQLNALFISIFGIEGELDTKVDEADVTVSKPDIQRDVRSFISYAVGCMFGRYSLDYDGLTYAGGKWDDSKYKVFYPDRDAIIPICDDEYFNDDIVGRFVRFVEVVFGKDTLEENLQFIAKVLGGKGPSREVIRNYFINDFYADHLKVYQKRPIYWLFDSGKKNGFKSLIYMHRYQPDTIARIRTDYVHEQQSRYRTAIADLESRIANTGTGERVKLSKQLTKLQEQAEELRAYEEKIHHLADQMIRIDLDDGVKHNYAIFQDVLAKIK